MNELCMTNDDCGVGTSDLGRTKQNRKAVIKKRRKREQEEEDKDEDEVCTLVLYMPMEGYTRKAKRAKRRHDQFTR